MVCQRCFNNEDVRYRAHSDIMDIMVCPTCAEEARQLEITVEFVDSAPLLAVEPSHELATQPPAYSFTPRRRRRPVRRANSDN